MPESLVASHLAPGDFGAYLATGSAKRTRGTAIFFKLADAYAEARMKELGVAEDLGRPPSKGVPRRSLYLGIYRVLEHTPIDALETLHLATADGRVLTLDPGEFAANGAKYHLYQELCPVTPRVVTERNPKDFGAFLTDGSHGVSVPAIVFADLKLQQLATDPDAKNIDDLPYPNIDHLRDCLRELKAKPGKKSKTVIRYLSQDVLFRTLEKGFYVAKADGGFRYFPMPSHDDLETVYFHWWRSAQRSFDT
jgi:hypothetical protein